MRVYAQSVTNPSAFGTGLASMKWRDYVAEPEAHEAEAPLSARWLDAPRGVSGFQQRRGWCG